MSSSQDSNGCCSLRGRCGLSTPSLAGLALSIPQLTARGKLPERLGGFEAVPGGDSHPPLGDLRAELADRRSPKLQLPLRAAIAASRSSRAPLVLGQVHVDEFAQRRGLEPVVVPRVARSSASSSARAAACSLSKSPCCTRLDARPATRYRYAQFDGPFANTCPCCIADLQLAVGAGISARVRRRRGRSVAAAWRGSGRRDRGRAFGNRRRRTRSCAA